MTPDEIRRIEHEMADPRLPLDPDVTVEPRPYPHPLTLIRSNADLLPAIAVGGVLGSLARWGLSEALPHDPGEFPWATWIANVSGALLLGLLMAFVLDVWAHHRYTRPFVGVGILGGYTTFSTWMLDVRSTDQAGVPGVALLYLGSTLVAGLIAVAAGLAVGRLVIDARRDDAS
ncbi:MAG: CrcB family protein [Nocardioides sp.]|uniref:fluoride efflux transporter FluC n=1 Tax=Nocardioides sp. TaxID=35761 RepID=UPI0039E463F5